MSRAINKLSARAVATEKKPGWHSDGGGLYLRITTDRRSWVLVYQKDKKRRELGLGSPPVVSLAEAREKAFEVKRRLAAGLPARDAPAPQETPVTFGGLAEDLISEWEKGWKNPKHRQQWRNTIATYCQPIADKHPAAISTDDVVSILGSIWLTKNETASRLRGRIERILSVARVKGIIQPPYENPARLEGHLEHILPRFDPAKRGHFTALPYDEVPAFMARLRERSGPAVRALEFTILTAARSHMTRGATWGEMDLQRNEWVIPKTRMKRPKDHTVPLTPRMIELLGTPGKGLIFPSDKGGELSDGGMERVLDRMKIDVTVHGFRSSFKDWAANATDFADEVSEEILAHTIGSKTRRAYRREEALEKRRALLEQWEGYCGSGG